MPPATPGKKRRPAAKLPAAWWKRPLVLAGGGVGAALLLLAVGLWAAGLLRVKTNDGTIVLEDLSPDAEVLVDGQQVTVTWAGGAQAQVSVRPGTRQLVVTKDGVKVVGEQIAIEEGDRKVISAKWEPPAKAEAPPARPAPDKPAADAKPPATFKNGLGMEFVLVPRGKAWLGGGGGKLGEQEVEITTDFYLGKYEVTQEEWRKVTGVNPSHFSRQGAGKDAVKDIPDAELARFPVEGVSWNDARLFLEALNAKEKAPGWVYRLPTEAEWEYACRGGPTANKFDYGFDYYFEEPTNQMSPDDANFQHPGGLNRPCKVGSYKPNRLGLYDMHGNVLEWCEDALKDPNGNPVRAMRGGCHFFPTWWCRAAARVAHPPTLRGAAHDTGLRVARVPVAGAEGFVPLFNGKDKTGWQPLGPDEPNAWTVQDGVLVGRSQNWASLRTKRADYGDFHLRVEAMVDGDGGSVRFRHSLTGKPGPFVAQISTTGTVQTGSLLRKTLPDLHCPWWNLVVVPQSVAPANTWMTLEIIAVGDHVTVKVNGKTTADVRQTDGQRSGYITLYPERGNGLRFRKIEIKELK
jgi:formylglycine-generating enzyme required for sulfatase activity